ncbi:hypothetical protein [Sphingomonas sp. GV3]|jgi:hypothetical protein|uniref:hypothetical protein n=1 Tax=Sphingomonas sp. GV3 TaxID=3040671 RepID=UPI00280A7DEC|nr:hypothetical protein [Sphingomonas sp. GV3]
MMEPRPAPAWVVAVIRAAQGSEDATSAAALVGAASLFAMMVIRILVAWQTGLL